MSLRSSFRGLYKLCECKCGYLIPCINKKGQLARFKTHHNLKILKGEQHSQWKGGIRTKGDYTLTYAPDHPFQIDNCVPTHRLVYERYYNVCLLPWIDIHHKNGDTKDNRIENLLPITRNDHTVYHNKTTKVYTRLDMSGRRCSICGSKDTYKHKDGTFQWYGNKKDGFKCLNCYDKYIRKKKKK
jgi:hypothetical protein